MTSTVAKESVKPATYPLVELFELDTTLCDAIQGQVYYFTPMTNYTAPFTGTPEDYVKFGGITFIPFPIEASGWEYTVDGAPAKPTLSVSNVSKFLQSAVAALGDLVGARLTRIRTFANFLDGAIDADSGQHYPKDIFYVDQKTSQTKSQITWSLISSVERGGVQLPLRQILREGPGGVEAFPGAARVRLK